jgi:hypothetical protein
MVSAIITIWLILLIIFILLSWGSRWRGSRD